jgi:hypothetical protein
MKDVIELALGTNGTYFVSYRDHDDQVLCKHYNLPNALTSWLYGSHPSVVRDLSSLSITLGPYDSYYAWDKSCASWSNLPPKLEKSILNRLESQDAWRTVWKAGGAEAPSFVSLGADEAYWMRTVSGGGCWDLKISAPPSNPGATDGMAGLRGTNKFLEDSSNFCNIAVSLLQSNETGFILISIGPPSLPISPRRLHPYHHSRQSVLKFTRVHLARLQQDGPGTANLRADHVAHTTHATAAPATTTISGAGTIAPAADTTTSTVPTTTIISTSSATTQLLSTVSHWSQLLPSTSHPTKTSWDATYFWICRTTELTTYVFQRAHFCSAEWVYERRIYERPGV